MKSSNFLLLFFFFCTNYSSFFFHFISIFITKFLSTDHHEQIIKILNFNSSILNKLTKTTFFLSQLNLTFHHRRCPIHPYTSFSMPNVMHCSGIASASLLREELKWDRFCDLHHRTFVNHFSKSERVIWDGNQEIHK